MNKQDQTPDDKGIQAGASRDDDVVLGSLSGGEVDTQLTPPAPSRSYRKDTLPAPTTTPAPPEDDQPLALPRGGLVALRRSGGFVFTSREVVIYKDGAVRYRRVEYGREGRRRTVRRLTPDELAEVRQLIEQADLRVPVFGRVQKAHQVANEMVARMGRETYAVEVFDGDVPAPIAPLLQRLRSFLPTDET